MTDKELDRVAAGGLSDRELYWQRNFGYKPPVEPEPSFCTPEMELSWYRNKLREAQDALAEIARSTSPLVFPPQDPDHARDRCNALARINARALKAISR